MWLSRLIGKIMFDFIKSFYFQLRTKTKVPYLMMKMMIANPLQLVLQTKQHQNLLRRRKVCYDTPLLYDVYSNKMVGKIGDFNLKKPYIFQHLGHHYDLWTSRIA